MESSRFEAGVGAAKERAMSNAMRWFVMAAVVCFAGAASVQAQGLPGVPTGTVLS
jgi:hypothetical protein